MASNIEFETIDAGFPVAGVDNNSQGFRDNFSIIRTSLADARSEVTDLQENAARKDEDNDFANNSLIRVNLDTMTLSYVAGGTVLDATEVNVGNGHYQTYVIDSNLTFTLAGWPNENVATMVVELIGANAGPYVVSFISENSGNFMSGGAGFLPESSTAIKLDIDVDSSTDPKIIEFWSYDNGETVYARYLGTYNDSVSASTEITGDATITGDLTVEGTFNLPAGTNIQSVDNIDNVDAGAPSDDDLLIYNSGAGEWQAGKLTAITADVTGDIIADDGDVLIDHVNKTFEGNVTGDLTGNVTGNVTGSVFANNTDQLIEGSTGSVTPNTLIMPSYNTTERDAAYPTPQVGTVIFNTTTSTFQGYNGTAWADMTA